MQKKHRWAYYVAEYDDVPQASADIPIVVEPPLKRFRQPVSRDDLRAFLPLIPDWDAHAAGLACLVLGGGDHDCYGWHGDGVICLDAWEGFEQHWRLEFFEEHRSILERLMVPFEPNDDGRSVRCAFTKKSAAAFQLMHVFLHELGHHRDRMATRNKTHSPLGEDFAEDFAHRLADRIWDDFFEAFGL